MLECVAGAGLAVCSDTADRRHGGSPRPAGDASRAQADWCDRGRYPYDLPYSVLLNSVSFAGGFPTTGGFPK